MPQREPPLTCYDKKDVTYFALGSLYAPIPKTLYLLTRDYLMFFNPF